MKHAPAGVLVFLLLTPTMSLLAQSSVPVASLRPGRELAWQRTSPGAEKPDGPVLYQIIFRSNATANHIPRIAPNYTLTNSLISDDGTQVAIGGLSITPSGMISFANGQSFPGAGTVTSVTAGSGLIGGTITSSGTLSLDWVSINSVYPQLSTANTFGSGTQVIQTGAAGTVGLAVQGASAQTANLQEWRSNTGTAVASVSGSGVFSGDGSGLTNLSSSQLVNGGINREQIALLKWYAANQTTSFAVGTGPNGVAFDGTNIWVANNSSDNVSKLRVSDGALLGTYTVGSGPFGVAFDGANIWVTNLLSNNVSKLRASDGSLLGTYPVGNTPLGVAFDGANIWVTNHGSSNVSKLRASDGALLATYAVAGDPGVAFDGANIWLTNFDGNNVRKLRASDGAVLGTYPVGTRPWGIAFDGANLWVTNYGSNTVSKLRASDGAVLGTYSVGSNPRGVAFDGANIWVANANDYTVSQLRPSDGTVLSTYSVGNFPWGVAFDGANIWVANSGSNTVSKL